MAKYYLIPLLAFSVLFFGFGASGAQAATPLTCVSSHQIVSAGQTVTFSAIGGEARVYSWAAANADWGVGFERVFTTQFPIAPALDEIRTATVWNGYQSATCSIIIRGSPVLAPTLTITPTVTPTPGTTLLEVRKLGKNITRGQDTEQTALLVSANDTLEFVIRIKSLASTTLTNINVADSMPSGVNYINRSTSVNGTLASDGITGPGINIASLAPGQEVVVRLNARVHAGSVFPSGTNSVLNTVQVRTEDNKITASAQLPVSYGQVAGASISQVAGVATGTADSILISLVFAGLTTYGYSRYYKRKMSYNKNRHIYGLNFQK